LNDLTDVLPDGWTNDRATLETAINSAGMVDGDPYMTAGATPSAVAFARASQVFANAPERAPNGMRYRRVVIFVTDGVANVLRNGMQNNYGAGCELGGENVGCQMGDPLPDGSLRPLNAMVAEAQALKEAYIRPSDGSVYVVALSPTFETTGLNLVASQPDYVKRADIPEQLQQIFDDIQVTAIQGDCTPSQGEERDSMDPSEVPTDLRPETDGSHRRQGDAHRRQQQYARSLDHRRSDHAQTVVCAHECAAGSVHAARLARLSRAAGQYLAR
jgi:hypothetical protein